MCRAFVFKLGLTDACPKGRLLLYVIQPLPRRGSVKLKIGFSRAALCHAYSATLQRASRSSSLRPQHLGLAAFEQKNPPSALFVRPIRRQHRDADGSSDECLCVEHDGALPARIIARLLAVTRGSRRSQRQLRRLHPARSKSAKTELSDAKEFVKTQQEDDTIAMISPYRLDDLVEKTTTTTVRRPPQVLVGWLVGS